jgi:hypothetical protein
VVLEPDLQWSPIQQGLSPGFLQWLIDRLALRGLCRLLGQGS